MDTSDNSTIPIRDATTTTPATDKSSRPKRQPRRRLPIFIKTGFYVALLGLVGWSCWRCFGPASRTDSPDAITDLEGFESAPAFSSVPKLVDTPLTESTSISFPPALPDEAINTVRSEPVAAQDRIKEVRVNSSTVWLSGTIEEEEAISTRNDVLRISGSPNDPTSVR